MRPADLPGEARELYEAWRVLGRTEAQAVDEVQRSGLLEELSLAESFRQMGLSEAAVQVASRGRGPAPTRPPGEADTAARMFDAFVGLGLSESRARIAAAGRL